VLDFDDKEIKPMLVVNCFITPDSTVAVDLTHTVSVLENTDFFTPVKNASVSIDDGSQIFSDFNYVPKLDSIYYFDANYIQKVKTVENGHYENKNIRISGNQKYNLEIAADGFERIKAETFLPSMVPIEKIDTFSSFQEDQYNYIRTKNAQIYFSDDNGQINYYRVTLEIAGISVTVNTISNEYPIIPNYYIASINSTDPVFGTEDNDDIFGGYSYNRFSIFDDKLFNGKNYGLILSLKSDYVTKGSEDKPININGVNDIKTYNYTLYKIKLISLSESMYHYLRTVTLQQASENDPFSDPVLVYSNVENGAGIFGGYCESEKLITENNFPEELLSLLPSQNDEELFRIIKSEYSKYPGIPSIYK
jgi:hypothetical protein